MSYPARAEGLVNMKYEYPCERHETTCPSLYTYLLLGQDMTKGQFFKAEFNRFEFRVSLLLD